MSYGQNSFNKDCNFTSINFGVNKPLLETELNEMQLILGTKPKEVIHTIFGDGLLTETQAPYITYSNGTLTLANTQAMINGELITIDSVKLTGLTNNNTVYLTAWYEEVLPNSLIPKYGNTQSTQTVTNTILDPRIGETTTTRTQLVYALSKTAVSGKMNLLIGRVVSSTFNVECVNIRENIGGLDLEALYPILEPYETKVSADGKHSQTLKDAKAYTDSRITALQSTVTGLSNTVNTLQSTVTGLSNKINSLEQSLIRLVNLHIENLGGR